MTCEDEKDKAKKKTVTVFIANLEIIFFMSNHRNNLNEILMSKTRVAV